MLKSDDIIYDDKKREYKILEPIGHGGMGYILLVERLSDKKQFAVKTLSVFIEGDNDYRALLNEGKLAEGIRHKNVIQYEYFHNGETYPNLPPYIIMELAEKQNLQDLIDSHIKSNTPLDQNELLNLYSNLIDGIEAINTVLVHRDIKPANILFKDGELKISDFGIAKISGDLTRTKTFKGSGTFPFFPPEAFLNKANTVQMDIYSMGIVFYLLATLKHPYEIGKEMKNEDDWKNAHLYALPAPPQNLNKSISPKVFAIILKMIEKNPSKRFSSWEEIRSEMKSIDKLKGSSHSDIIEKMITKISEKNIKARQVELERTKKLEEENQKKQIIIYQLVNDIIQPLEEFAKDYNTINSSPDDRISIQEESFNSFPSKDKIFVVRTANSSSRIEISIRIIGNDDYLSREVNDIFGDTYQKKLEPLLNRRQILAWGIVEENMGKGFNIVLVKSEASEYGEWFILKNTHSGFAQSNDGRPEPFPFKLSEIRNEIHNIGAVHIYNTQVSPLNPKIIINFISDL